MDQLKKTLVYITIIIKSHLLRRLNLWIRINVKTEMDRGGRERERVQNRAGLHVV